MRVTARVGQALAVAAGALLLLWPALLNGYPLLYPDSMSYLADGRPLARILCLHAPRGYLAMRSEFYSLGIFPFHWNVTAWPVVVLQALLASYILWLVVRSLHTRPVAGPSLPPRNPVFNLRPAVLQFLAVTAFVSLTTGVAWYACFIMPDILGPVLYLGIFLLVFASDALSAAERCAVVLIAAWAMASHSTHLLLAAFLCGLLALLCLLRFPPLRSVPEAGRPDLRQSWATGMGRRLRSLAGIAAIIVTVAVVQMALHGNLYGRPSLFGNRMPYTLARLVADGPGRWYLQSHCGTQRWALCARVNDLPDNDDDFLWTEGGVWRAATPAQRQQMLAQEWPLIFATLRAYPGAQLRVSLENFGTELTEFGLWDFTNGPWIDAELDPALPGAMPTYLRTRQAQGRLPNIIFTAVQSWVVLASCIVIAAGVPLAWRRRRWRLLGLATILVPVVFANAFLAAVFSEVDSRYQARVIWLIPLLAALMLWG